MLISGLAVGAGWVLLGFGAAFARSLPRIDDQLRQHRIGELSPDADLRWPSRPRTLYRTAGWPLLDALRRNTILTYVFGISGVLCLMYGCPAILSR